ncbi:MAG: type I glutamate--ammonia ligase [Microcoleus sp. PH2017_29_MFU_D_A]|jgi:glutamine synthetase|uniref:type I glutamate--ammonia ligase n=1 Tax=unclassified Microcoleus TaxID=2642155 RepID=UPI001DBC3D52|nr:MULTISPECIES: type I glutamate--ammonia ligase [unclassified Microcoleus]MCC3420336.1 type I glutamate--ammonia ligase [Microcoleus sp. PH2017_07_MST_O_A]MCC3430645.1 type I glutamate--ammonia ligase [Microcoleus sp. PH2017_04_SCI_O_A]MCC3444047.1 type I glutamate--ammonia ligase [Microcoleus sp. PH2017_03_ELD_O_A]MCC3468746.1 type I glutamate--ammonia ligase [Microcoleus sp. PH2017_06_SFM_O_A]MCC3505758.1 type I glutamate--ammonia ligase [Microcoleus sp. PH2017_19_SFW_U_A]MCC3512064.1 typ
MFQTPQEALNYIKENKIQIVDLKFIDMPGIWQHLSLYHDQIDETAFTDGVPFDGSSIRGWKAINESDMTMVIDPTTAWMDPFMAEPTISFICSIKEPRTGEPYSRCPRTIAQKAIDYLLTTGLGDTAFFGPEAEFFIFDDVRFDQTQNSGYYYVDSVEGRWNSGKEEAGGNLGYKPRYKEGYFPVAPTDTSQDMRTEMLLTMAKCGVPIEKHHHEVATGGQCELGFRFATLVQAADYLLTYKYVIKNVGKKYGKTITFMPKPLFNDNGSGMHVHQSIWKDGQPLFAGDQYAGFSQMGLHYIGGILKHAPALLAITNPTTNSYKRLVPGFEAPVNLAYSQGNRSASVRIPLSGNNPKAKRLEFRCPDATSNPYLAFAAMLCAGLDGIKNQIDPGEPLDVDIYDLSPEELAKVPSTPGSLEGALEALEKDHAFLTETGVFTEDFIQTWISYKLDNEVNPMRLRPHPYEFALYYDC